MANSIQTLKKIRSQLNDLAITDPHAHLLEQFFTQSIILVEAFQNPAHDLFEIQKRNILKSLSNELVQYQQSYWGKTDKAGQINGFTLARRQLHLLLGQALSTCQRRNFRVVSKPRENTKSISSLLSAVTDPPLQFLQRCFYLLFSQ